MLDAATIRVAMAEEVKDTMAAVNIRHWGQLSVVVRRCGSLLFVS